MSFFRRQSARAQRNDLALYEREKAEVEAHFPELHFTVEDDIVYVRGSFALMFEGQVLDRYSVELQLHGTIPPDYLSSGRPGGVFRAVTTSTSTPPMEPPAWCFLTSDGACSPSAVPC